MNSERFKKVVEARVKRCIDTLTAKSDEYSTDADKFHNFHMGAAFLGFTREQVLMMFWMKHIISLVDMIKSGKKFPQDVLDEKIGDAMCYLFILDGMVKEHEAR